jgi:Centromere DNA-binding protein complex CBF3 subunit, domain 2
MWPQCFLDLLAWFRIVILQDAVFLRKKFPSLNLWKGSPFNDPVFEEFSNIIFHKANFGDDPKYIQIAKAMPKNGTANARSPAKHHGESIDVSSIQRETQKSNSSRFK